MWRRSAFCLFFRQCVNLNTTSRDLEIYVFTYKTKRMAVFN
jgi:hypothetical protein